MFVTGWLPVDGWMVGWLALRLISYVAGWLAGWLGVSLPSSVAAWLQLAAYVVLQPADLVIGWL